MPLHAADGAIEEGVRGNRLQRRGHRSLPRRSGSAAAPASSMARSRSRSVTMPVTALGLAQETELIPCARPADGCRRATACRRRYRTRRRAHDVARPGGDRDSCRCAASARGASSGRLGRHQPAGGAGLLLGQRGTPPRLPPACGCRACAAAATARRKLRRGGRASPGAVWRASLLDAEPGAQPCRAS